MGFSIGNSYRGGADMAAVEKYRSDIRSRVMAALKECPQALIVVDEAEVLFLLILTLFFLLFLLLLFFLILLVSFFFVLS